MLEVDKSDLADAMRTIGWLDMQTGAVIFWRTSQRREDHEFEPDRDVGEYTDRYIRLPRISPVQQAVHFLEIRRFSKEILEKHALGNYADFKSDVKLIYPTFYGSIQLTTEENELLRGMHDLYEDWDAMTRIDTGENEADCQFEIKCIEAWATEHNLDLTGSWESVPYHL